MNGTETSGSVVAVVLASATAVVAAALVGAGWLRAHRADRDDPAKRRAQARPRARRDTDPVLASLGLDYRDRPEGDDDPLYRGWRSR